MCIFALVACNVLSNIYAKTERENLPQNSILDSVETLLSAYHKLGTTQGEVGEFLRTPCLNIHIALLLRRHLKDLMTLQTTKGRTVAKARPSHVFREASDKKLAER